MSRMFGDGMDIKGMIPEGITLVLNRSNSLIKALMVIRDREERKEDVSMICEQVYDLAMMSHKQLEVDAMTWFIERSKAA